MKKYIIAILIISFALHLNAQQQKLYYNFPENIKSQIGLRLNEQLTLSKKDNYSSQTILIVNTRGGDTTLVWIVKFSKDIPELNAVINNSNRFFKYIANSNETDIPIIFEADLDWADPVRKEKVINNKKIISITSMMWGGWLIKFVFRGEVAPIIEDKFYGH
jgi:hypothetical protein